MRGPGDHHLLRRGEKYGGAHNTGIHQGGYSAVRAQTTLGPCRTFSLRLSACCDPRRHYLKGKLSSGPLLRTTLPYDSLRLGRYVSRLANVCREPPPPHDRSIVAILCGGTQFPFNTQNPRPEVHAFIFYHRLLTSINVCSTPFVLPKPRSSSVDQEAKVPRRQSSGRKKSTAPRRRSSRECRRRRCWRSSRTR